MARTGIVYTCTVEDGTLYIGQQRDDGWAEELPNDEFPSKYCQASSVQARSGQYSIRFRWDSGDPLNGGDVRAELKRPSGIRLQAGQEYWIGYSVFFEDNTNNTNYVNDDLSNKSVTQWHNTAPTRGTSQLMTRNGQWQYEFGAFPIENVGAVVLGQWNDFVLHVKLTEGSGTDGFAHLWLNADSDAETPVYTHTGQSIVAGEDFLNPKIGIYHGKDEPVGRWAARGFSYIEFYIDEYRIGDETSDFASVKPGEASVPPPGGGEEYGEITYVAEGNVSSSSLAQTVQLPSGVEEDDALVLAVECDGNDTPVTPSGWLAVSGSPVVSSTSATGTQLAVFVKAAGASESAVTLDDFGNHHLCRMYAFRGVDPAQIVNASQATSNATLGTSFTISGPVTTIDGCMIFAINGIGTNAAQTGAANANLTGATEVSDILTTSGTDGGMYGLYGALDTAGVVGNTTMTSAVAAERASIVLALQPAEVGASGRTKLGRMSVMDILEPWSPMGVN